MKKTGNNALSGKKHIVVWSAAVAFLLVLLITVTAGMNGAARSMDFRFGGGEMIVTPAEGTQNWDTAYYLSAYGGDKGKIEEAARSLTERIEGEGIVLLKNENGTLPLDPRGGKEKNVSVFGWSFSHPVYGGSGSGAVDEESCITPRDGLEDAGFSVNPTLESLYADWSANTKRKTNAGKTVDCDSRPATDSNASGDWDIVEMPVAAATAAEAAEYSSVALVFLARQGGEGCDLPLNMGKHTFYGAGRTQAGNSFGYNENKHYLQLSDDEEELLRTVCAADFEKVVVVLNSSNAMQIPELQANERIGAILTVGGPGSTGFEALGGVLSGEVVPSGRTADVYAADFTQDPVFCNFSDPYYYTNDSLVKKRNEYTNVNLSNTGYANGYFVQYEEGIYMGYRWYETAAREGVLDYAEAVVYPFGYGLSYTEFRQSILSYSVRGGRVSVTVNVENAGKRAGKDVIQLYYTAPFGKKETGSDTVIEKPSKVLAAFDKTDVIEAGESRRYTLEFAVEDMASYDDKAEKCYVLDAGVYTITLGKNSHDAWESFTYENPSKIVYGADNPRQSERNAQKDAVLSPQDTVAAVNAFGDFLVEEEMNKMVPLSREEDFTNLPAAPTDMDRIASGALIESIQKYDVREHQNETAEYPLLEKENGLSLADLRGKEYGDPAWETLLDQMSVRDMKLLASTGGFGTADVASVGKPKTLDNDGPQALKYGDWAGTPGKDTAALNAFPTETVIACTWNEDLCAEWGAIVGEEGLAYKTTGWYAPGLNLHRSPFGGRNFEYFSEDPLLSGKMGARVISAAAEKGIVAYMKHFAVNEQESYRSGWKYNTFNGVYTWASEQTMRELYFRPFEIAVKEAKAAVRYIADTDGTVKTKTVRAAVGVMSGLNAVGNCWAGCNGALLQTVLRGEWGFRGTVITDYRTDSRVYMNPDRMLRGGGDMILYQYETALADESSATAVLCLREACHNILYTYCHSNAMQGIAPGAIVTYARAPWQTALLVAWCVFDGVVLLGCVSVAIRLVRARIKRNEARV